jgi:hypothetical protein
MAPGALRLEELLPVRLVGMGRRLASRPAACEREGDADEQERLAH